MLFSLLVTFITPPLVRSVWDRTVWHYTKDKVKAGYYDARVAFRSVFVKRVMWCPSAFHLPPSKYFSFSYPSFLAMGNSTPGDILYTLCFTSMSSREEELILISLLLWRRRKWRTRSRRSRTMRIRPIL